jgi:hypothetical protein
MSLSHGASIVRDGLVLHLDAANIKSYPGSGTVWNDLSGNDHDGTLINGVGYSTDNKGTLTFDGVDDYTSLPDNITDLSGDWSINIWMRPYSDANPRVMTLLTAADNLTVGYIQTTLVPYIRIDNSSVVSSSSLVSGEWVNVVYQISNSTREIYINSNATTVASGGITANGLYSAIGGGYTNYQMNGDISIGSLYSRALSAAEIQQNFNALRGRYGI